MSTVRFTIPVRPQSSKRTVRAPQTIADPRRGDRSARMLALAHRIECEIDAGTIRDYAHAARLFGITRARISQIVGLTNLAPDIQARLLAGETNIHERSLRAALRTVDWDRQRAALKERKHEATN